MGIPSPHASPLLALKQAVSPELPLGAIQEIVGGDEACELLPPSTVDLNSEKVLADDAKTTWADTKTLDASASGDEHDDHSEGSTSPPQSESLESRSNSSAEKTLTPAEVAVERNTSILLEILQSNEVTKAPVSSLVAGREMVSSNPMQLLCEIRRNGNAGMSMIPCMGDDLAADCEHGVFWCNVQPQRDGCALITPCTDACECGVVIDASGSPLDSPAESVGEPARPPQGAHAPVWVYGAQWPHCVAPTTLVLSNLPDSLLQEDLIEILDKEGYSGFYDFFYLPTEPDHCRNLGYAIINLTRHEYGLSLSALMHGRASWCGVKSAQCQVSWSMPLQGVTELVGHYHYAHPACHESVPLDMRPTFFSGGWPRPLPLSQN